MKKIYITSLHLNHGGVQFIVSQMANGFLEKGYEVQILCTYNFGKSAFLIHKDVHIDYLTDYKPNREEFKTALKTLRIDHLIKEGIKSLKILRAKKRVLKNAFSKITDGIIISTRNEDSVLLSRFGHPDVLKIAQIHHDVILGDKVSKDIRNKYNNIDNLVLLTNETRKDIKKYISDKKTHMKISTIENFIIPLEDDPPPVREKSIIAVGRFHQVKGFSRLLDIFSIVYKIHPDWKLEIIGDGLLKNELMEKVKNLKIDRNVSFPGFLDNLETRRRMQKASIYCMTSLNEGLPIVLIEAMDAGLPLISFDVRVGPREVIWDGYNGFLIEDDNLMAYADKLEKLMENEVLRLEISENSRERARNYYKENIIGKWIQLFESHDDIDRRNNDIQTN